MSLETPDSKKRVTPTSEAKPLLDKMGEIDWNEVKKALDTVQTEKAADPSAGIFVAKLDVLPVEIKGQTYFFYGARVLSQTGAGNQPYVTPHRHLKGTEPYLFGAGVGEMNFGKVVEAKVVYNPPVTVNPGDEFLIKEGEVHSFRNLAQIPVDFIFSCPESHLVDNSTEHPEGDRYIVKELEGGIPKHYN